VLPGSESVSTQYHRVTDRRQTNGGAYVFRQCVRDSGQQHRYASTPHRPTV